MNIVKAFYIAIHVLFGGIEMKKIIISILIIAIMSSYAIADNMSDTLLAHLQIAMLDDIDENTKDNNTHDTEEPIANPSNDSEADNAEPSEIDHENNIETSEDNQKEESIKEQLVETEEPIIENPIQEEHSGDDKKNPTVQTEESKAPEIKEETQPKPVPKIINTLNKKNAWSNKTVYLTFDDGPSSITNKMLDVLKDAEVKATFFVIGTKSDEGKASLKRIINEGHSLGNHTYSHNYNYIYKNTDNFFSDLYKNEDIIYEASGKRPKIIRFPGGSNNTATKTEKGKKVINEILDRLESEGYVHFDWNASSGDASAYPASVDDIINNTLTWINKKDTAVVLFHDTAAKTNTLKALPTIIEKLKFLGCKFEVLTTGSPQVAFVKNNKNTNSEAVTTSSKNSYRKPPYVLNKLIRLEMEMEERFVENKY